MPLDRITGKNYLSKAGPQIPVYSGWFNALVDGLSSIGYGELSVSEGAMCTSDGTFPDLPIAYPPSLYHCYFEDFVRSAASAAPDASWTVTEDDAACTQLLIDAAGGVLQLTCKAGTDDNGTQVQLQQESFKLATGKPLWFETRVRMPEADVTNIDFYVGLAVTEDLTGEATNQPANGIVLKKTDAGVGTVFCNVSDNDVDKVSAASICTMVTNTWMRLGFYFDGGATGSAYIVPYYNGYPATPIPAVTYATMSELAPIIGVRNGDGVTTQKLDVDYIFVLQER